MKSIFNTSADLDIEFGSSLDWEEHLSLINGQLNSPELDELHKFPSVHDLSNEELIINTFSLKDDDIFNFSRKVIDQDESSSLFEQIDEDASPANRSNTREDFNSVAMVSSTLNNEIDDWGRKDTSLKCKSNNLENSLSTATNNWATSEKTPDSEESSKGDQDEWSSTSEKSETTKSLRFGKINDRGKSITFLISVNSWIKIFKWT